MKNVLLIIVSLLSAYTANAQTSILKISREIELPKDSIESRRLISSLNQFLIESQANAKKNDWVDQSHFLHTALLLDEIEGIQEKENVFYNPVLLDVSSLEKDQFYVQVSYIGTKNDAPEIRANIELIAYKTEGKYLFSSPLLRNTRNWKKSTIENFTFYYRDTIDMNKAKDYQRLTTFYDKKLNIKFKEVAFYLFEDGWVSQKNFGLPYKMDYNGRGGKMSWSVLLESQDIHLVHISDFFRFDPHDLWHSRLSQIKSRRKVNHAVDEGIATLYGGSWGFSWKELFVEFENQIKFSQNTDWLVLREQETVFETGGHRNPADFMVNALLVKKIENEKGFSAVLELLNVKEEKAYFKTLKKLTGITKINYNKEVWKLVKREWNELKNT